MKVSNVIEQYRDFKLALGSGFKNEPYRLKLFLQEVGLSKINKITPKQVEKFLRGQGPLTR